MVATVKAVREEQGKLRRALAVTSGAAIFGHYEFFC
jgi:hypothetical protein